MLSLVAQLSSVVLAVLYGRFIAKSRATIWGAAGLGALGAYLAYVLVDGQGAFLFIFFVPIIYALSAVGRKDLDAGARLDR